MDDLYEELLDRLGVENHDDAMERINELLEYEYMYKSLL